VRLLEPSPGEGKHPCLPASVGMSLLSQRSPPRLLDHSNTLLASHRGILELLYPCQHRPSCILSTYWTPHVCRSNGVDSFIHLLCNQYHISLKSIPHWRTQENLIITADASRVYTTSKLCKASLSWKGKLEPNFQ
jgi:hypothetical protein